MNDIQPIETHYNGYRFRSRLEARWAVFFDALGIEYQYEPEGYKFKSIDGIEVYYLPDFRIKCYGLRGCRDAEPFDLYIEVKGNLTEEDAKKMATFPYPLYLVNEIPNVETFSEYANFPILGEEFYFNFEDDGDWLAVDFYNYCTVDGDYYSAYPCAHNGHFYLAGEDGNYIHSDDVENVIKAFNVARQARFEHGETPKPPERVYILPSTPPIGEYERNQRENVKKFLENNYQKDLAFGGKQNFCDYAIVKTLISEQGLAEDGKGLIHLWFLDRHRECIIELHEKGADIDAIKGKGFTRKSIVNTLQNIEGYKKIIAYHKANELSFLEKESN